MKIRAVFVFVLLAFLALQLPLDLAKANVLGDMQTFAPNTDGLDFVTVHTSRPLNKGFFAFGGHFSYAKDHQLVFRDMLSQEKYDYRDQLVEFDTTVAYALSDKLSVFFAAPTLLYQEPDKDQDVQAYLSKGVHTYRPGFKYTFGEASNDFAFIGSIDILNVTNSPYTGIDTSNIYNLELAKTFRAKNAIAYGLNVGYRIRHPTERPADGNMFPLDDQYTASIGRTAPLWNLRKSRWVLEGIFSFPAKKAPYKDAMDASSMDILLGFKHRLIKNLNFDWGVTVEPMVDSLAPRYRAFAGLVYYWNPGWSSNQDRSTMPAQSAAPIAEQEAAEDEAQADPMESSAIAEDDSSAFPPFEVTPEYAEVFEGATVRMKATGGVGPYSYQLRRGRGRLNIAQTYYRAPLFPETAEIEVRDARSVLRIVKIVVKTPPKPNETIRIKNVNFIFATDIMIPSSRKEIDRLVQIFKKKKVTSIIVEGHTDSKGNDDYNMDLSEKRAAAVARVLVRELDLRSDQVTPIGFGEARPIATNATDRGRLANRRVDLKVYYR